MGKRVIEINPDEITELRELLERMRDAGNDDAARLLKNPAYQRFSLLSGMVHGALSSLLDRAKELH